jgi:hypothetical protein
VSEPVPGAWEPDNETERALAQAMVDGNEQAYFQIFAAARLYLPQFLTPPPSSGAEEPPGQVFLTANLFGETFLPVFTSVAAMAAQMAGAADGYTMTNYAELRHAWPRPDWRLAINPGTPIDAYVTIDAVEDAMNGTLNIPSAVEVVLEAAGRNGIGEPATGTREAGAPEVGTPEAPTAETDAALLAAAQRGDADGYVRILLDALVLVATAAPVADGAALFEENFPWRPSGPANAPTVEVFTSPEMLRRVYPGPVPTLTVSMPYLLGLWPAGFALSVNPGSTIAIDLPADQVQLLLAYTMSS